MKMNRMIAVTTLGVSLIAGGVFAQHMMGRPHHMNPAAELAAIFGQKSFTATAMISMQGPDGKSMHNMEVKYAVLNGKVRTETDMSKMMGSQMPAEALARIKQMGLDQSIHIILPKKNMAYLIYPKLKAYAEMSTATDETNSKGKEEQPKVERTKIGKDTLDGHPCVKYKVTVTPKGGQPVITTVWQATDMDNYPIQTQVEVGRGMVVTTHFKDMNRSKPAASLFEPPAGYKKYDSMQALMMSTMHGMMPPPPPAPSGH